MKNFSLILIGALIFSCSENKTNTNESTKTQAGSVVTGMIVEGENAVGDDFQGKIAPNFSWKDAEGNLQTLENLRGKVVILDFWATWCPPCRAEIPHFIDLYSDYSSKGLVIVGVSVDQEGISVVENFVKQNKMNYPQVVVKEDVVRAYGISPIPTTFILDKEGKIVNRYIGYNEKIVFEEEIKKLF
ncbi:TlpA family protein disulfide reductase [bacterium]|nr:TlpA family protein disulfide reductase [bacterium]